MKPWPFIPPKNTKIKKACLVHIEQMSQAGETVSQSQLANFVYHQIPFRPEKKEQNKKLAEQIAKEVLFDYLNK